MGIRRAMSPPTPLDWIAEPFDSIDPYLPFVTYHRVL